MNKTLFTILSLISISINAQQYVEPTYIEIPTNTIKYEMDGKLKHFTVYNFYINSIPESIGDYKIYIKSNKEDIDNKIYPRKESLKSKGLNDEEIDFILNHYYIDDIYENYPIIGLEADQIEKYLAWKVEYIGFQILASNNIANEESLPYTEFYKMYKDSINIPCQVNLIIPIEEYLISAHDYTKRNQKKKTIQNKENEHFTQISILNRFDLYPVQQYNLTDTDIYKKLDEIIKIVPRRGHEIPNDKKVIAISNNEQNKYITKFDNALFKPWRTSQIKLK